MCGNRVPDAPDIENTTYVVSSAGVDFAGIVNPSEYNYYKVLKELSVDESDGWRFHDFGFFHCIYGGSSKRVGIVLPACRFRFLFCSFIVQPTS